jgi:hypothetical protein
MARDRRERLFTEIQGRLARRPGALCTPRMGHCAEHRDPTADCLAAPFSQDGPLPELGHAAAPTACGTCAGALNEKGPQMAGSYRR